MGYIKRIGDKKYRIVYDLPRGKDGMRRQKTETIVGKSKPDAEAHLMTRKQQIANLQPIVDEALTVDELYERFMTEKKRSRRFSGKYAERRSPLHALSHATFSCASAIV